MKPSRKLAAYCVCVYAKNPGRTILLHLNSGIVLPLFTDNAIPIKSWFSDAHDTALLDLLPMLDALRFTNDVRSVLSRNLHLHSLWWHTVLLWKIFRSFYTTFCCTLHCCTVRRILLFCTTWLVHINNTIHGLWLYYRMSFDPRSHQRIYRVACTNCPELIHSCMV